MNDLAPVFTMGSYSSTISETHPVGTPIGITVSATDPEVGHTVTYFTLASEADSAFFSVGQTSGVISLTNGLDADPPTGHSTFQFSVCVHVNSRLCHMHMILSFSLSLSQELYNFLSYCYNIITSQTII